MREWFKQLPAKIVEFWNKYTARQKVLFFSVLAAVIITLVALVLILNRTTYTFLTSFDDTATTAKAASILEENSISIKVSDDALSINVAEDQLSKARLILGENGISSTVNNTDYTWLFDNSFNTTDSEKRLKAKISLQSTIALDICDIEGINKASVTIDIPDNTNSIYAKDETTSVSIKINTNSNFKEESAKTIAQYAATCVGNPDTKNITIIDNQGNLLFSGSSNANVANEVIFIKQQVEEYYNSKLWNLMVNSGVYDEVSVSSDLKVNVSPESITDTQFYSNDEDDTGPKGSRYYYMAENTDGTGGVVGTDANGEEITDYDLLDEANGASTLNIIKEEYNTSSTVTVTSKPVGEVDMGSSSMAMYLTKYQVYDEEDMEKSGELEGTTFNEFQAANSDIQETVDDPETVALLSMATGIKTGSIKVVERIVPLFYPKAEKSIPIKSIISIALAVIIGGLLLFVVFKSMKPAEVIETEPELSVEALLATTKENQTLDDIEFSDKSGTRVMIEKFVDENPEAVASLLRNWLNDDWE